MTQSLLVMAGPKILSFLAAMTLFACPEVLTIQNGATHSRSSRSEITVPGAPSVRAKTSDDQVQPFSQNLQKTRDDAWKLESSKSIDDLELEFDETHYLPSFSNVATVSSSDGPAIDAFTSSKLIDQIDNNQIEVKPGDYYRNIGPTKSETLSGEGRGAPQGQDQLVSLWSEPQEQSVRDSQSSSLQPRQGRRDQQPGRIFSKHAPLPPETPVPNNQRQANPDIQDIITGIVKLLNGKVNVAVSSSKPVRPVQSTRINNRGPPRISDVVPLPPDFDTPGMNPPPLPSLDQPSTFETPPAPSQPSFNQLPPELPFITGIRIPESIIPQMNRPWNRPQRPGTRKPMPPYKPLSPANTTSIPDQDAEKTNSVLDLSDKINQDKNKTMPSQTTKGEHSNHLQKESQQRPHASPTRYHTTLKTDNPIADNTLVLGGIAPQPLTIPTTNETADEPRPVIPLKSDAPDFQTTEKISKVSPTPTTNKAVFQTMLNIETSSSVQVIETTSTKTLIEPNIVPLAHSDYSEIPSIKITTPSSTTFSIEELEPSKASIINSELSSRLSTPTEGLTTNLIKTTITHQKSSIQPYTNSITFSKGQSSVYSYRPRPGIVLDDTLDYAGSQGLNTQRPYGPPRHTSSPDTFDVVVSAIQGPGQSGTGEVRVPINGAHNGNPDDILTSPIDGQGFVSIDGKRTYLPLFDNTEGAAGPSKIRVQPTRTPNVPVLGTGFAVPQAEITGAAPRPSASGRRPPFLRRPTQPPVRIDTCIVGDSSTCDTSQHEACATVQGVSACHCKPGFARLTHTLPCKRVVSIVVSIRVDRIYDRKVIWDRELEDRDSEFHHTLTYEASRAIESAMSMTPFSDEYVGAVINNLYQGDISQGQGGVFVNATLKLAYEVRTAKQSFAGELQKHLVGVIQRRSNNIGNSALHVDTPAGSISNVQDLDECASSELNDCHSSAVCSNTWGGFTCACNGGLKDLYKGDHSMAGRTCVSCPTSQCNNRGTCSYQGDQMQCSCTGNYYGAQCEIDGEVLGVAIGASVAALIIIVLTLVCLVMWSRKWSREQKAISPVYGYVQGTLPGTLPAHVGSMGTLASVKQGPPSTLPPYMWATVADHLATGNVYATEPMSPTRPSSAVFGYPPLSLHGTLPPVPLPRLQTAPRPRQRHQPPPEPDSSDSEPHDNKDRADLIPQHNHFQVPRPKSRSSLANQSGIYYDVEYDQGDARHLSKNNIPMSTYSMAPYYRT